MDELQSGAENLEMMARLRGLPAPVARARAGELLERFDLVSASRRRTATYSGGMRRRLDLAASLVRAPEVLSSWTSPRPVLTPAAGSRCGSWSAT